MKARNILYALILLAYTLSLAHSVIPHHHHKTADEANAHHESHDHHNAGHAHQHDDDHQEAEHSEGSNHTSHFFFFSHDINADVLIKHNSIDSPVKIKKASASVQAKEPATFRSVSDHIVFHPPPDDRVLRSITLQSNALRGPPALLI